MFLDGAFCCIISEQRVMCKKRIFRIFVTKFSHNVHESSSNYRNLRFKLLFKYTLCLNSNLIFSSFRIMAWEHGPLHAQQYIQCTWCSYFIWRANYDEHLQNHHRHFVKNGPKEAEAKVEIPASNLPAQDTNQEPDSTTDQLRFKEHFNCLIQYGC